MTTMKKTNGNNRDRDMGKEGPSFIVSGCVNFAVTTQLQVNDKTFFSEARIHLGHEILE